MVDTRSGELDTWPAHASGLILSSAAAMLSKDKSFIVARERESGMAPLIPKPRFLQQLENFLKKELVVLGVTEVTPSDLRLQVIRQAGNNKLSTILFQLHQSKTNVKMVVM